MRVAKTARHGVMASSARTVGSSRAAQRLRFPLDTAYATRLRASELLGTIPCNFRLDEYGYRWPHLGGRDGRPGKVAVAPLERRLPVTPREELQRQR